MSDEADGQGANPSDVSPLCRLGAELSNVVCVPYSPIAVPFERLAALQSLKRALEALKTTTPDALLHRQLALDDLAYARTRFVVDPVQYALVCGQVGCEHFATPTEPHLRCSGCQRIAYCGASHQKLCAGDVADELTTQALAIDA